MKDLPPHPYQSYAPASYAAATVQQTYYVHHHHHHHHHHPAPPHNPPLPRPLSKYRPIIALLLFLPVPPLLAVLYVVVGHSLLRRASSGVSNTDPWSPSLLSSANAAATGGIILSLPLFPALYLILPLPRPPAIRARTPMDDFFEDDDDDAGRGACARVVVYVACAVILLCVGAAAAALGVTCLTGGSVVPGEGKKELKTQRELARSMLTPGRAAEAGIVGGAVLLGAVLALVVVGVLGWWWWVSHRRRQADEKA
ncbi:hypothetical protein C0989_004265 [Termitomyces sp. Mn162]|nr:hypothetical protein C0989_004265 [Termitomyces sp. Mn162]